MVEHFRTVFHGIWTESHNKILLFQRIPWMFNLMKKTGIYTYLTLEGML